MSSNKFLSKALNTVSAIVLSGVLLGPGFLTSAQAMLDPEDDAFRAQQTIIPAKTTTDTTEEYEPKLALSASPFYDLDKNIVYEIMMDSIEKDKGRLPLTLVSKYFLELSQRGEQPYDTLLSLSESPFKKLDDVALLKIMILSLGNKKQLPFAAVSRYFHNLSYDGELSRTLTIKNKDELLKMFEIRNPSRRRALEQGQITRGYQLPSSLRICFAFGHTDLNPHLTPEDFQSLLKNFPHLTGLSLRDHCLKGENAKVLEQHLMNTSCLKELDVKGNFLFDKECDILSQGLSKNKTLTSLHLSFPSFVGELFNTICKLPLLKFLALEGLAKPWDLSHLSKAIEQNSSSLQVLDLSEATLLNNNQKNVMTGVCNLKNIQLKWDNKKLEKPPITPHRFAGTFVGGRFVPGDIGGRTMMDMPRSREFKDGPRSREFK